MLCHFEVAFEAVLVVLYALSWCNRVKLSCIAPALNSQHGLKNHTTSQVDGIPYPRFILDYDIPADDTLNYFAQLSG